MSNLLKQSKVQLILTLLPMLLLSPLNGFLLEQMISPIVIICSAVFFDLLFLKLRKVEIFFPSAAIATGIILSLIIDPSAPWYIFTSASLAAIFSKNFIRLGRHVFNPAAFGALTVALIFSSFTSWWGPSVYSNSFLYFLLFIPAVVSVYRMKRHLIIAPFLIVYSLISIFVFNNDLINLARDATLIFFSLVMLPEPMTTPNNHRRQILFGTSVAIFSFSIPIVLSALNIEIFNRVDPFIFSLLLANLLFFKFR